MMSKAELLDRLDELLAQALRGGIDPLYANRVLMDKASELAETATLIRARQGEGVRRWDAVMLTRFFLALQYCRKYGYSWSMAWALAQTEFELDKRLTANRYTK